MELFRKKMSVIRQKGECQNGCFKETKHVKFFEKRTFLTPLIRTRTSVSGGEKCSFFGKVGVLCFLETPVLRFTLLAYYWRYIIIFICVIWYHLYNFKNVKNTYGGVLLLGKSQALKLQAVTKSNGPSWVFFSFFKLYKWYQIMQCIAFLDSFQRRVKRFLSQFLFLSNWDWRCMG